ncbi:MAG: helix-turn-helix transcriptional regulator [Catonella sp.]|jgi:DNA-binding helix-turn-helix protein
MVTRELYKYMLCIATEKRLKMNKLKETRKAAKVKQSEIAKVCRICQQQVSMWELGKREIPVRHAKKIAELLRCDWRVFYD